MRLSLTRLLLSVGLGVVALGFGPVSASATPLRLDVRRMLAEPVRHDDFVPARAGWQGPETPQSSAERPNPALERFGVATTDRAVRASIIAAATPDPRALAALAAAILLLRWARHSRNRRELGPVLVEKKTAEDTRVAA